MKISYELKIDSLSSLNLIRDLLFCFYLLTTRRMEKLIELLNEMIKSKGNCYKIIDYTGGVFIIDDKANKYRCNLYPAVVISKEYGFIKRLIENDKINKDLIPRVLRRAYVSPETLVSIECEFYDYYISLLMILSIQDNPIEYLCSILKE